MADTDTSQNPYFGGIRTVLDAVNARAFGEGASLSSGPDQQVGWEVSVHLPKDHPLAHNLQTATSKEGAALDKQMGGDAQSPHMDVRRNTDGSVDLMFPAANLVAGNKGKPWTSADIQKQAQAMQNWSAGKTFTQTIGALPGAEVVAYNDKTGRWEATFSAGSPIAKNMTALADATGSDANAKLDALNASTGNADIGFSKGSDGSITISATPAEINGKPGEFKTAANALPGTLASLTEDHPPLSSVSPPAPSAAPAQQDIASGGHSPTGNHDTGTAANGWVKPARATPNDIAAVWQAAHKAGAGCQAHVTGCDDHPPENGHPVPSATPAPAQAPAPQEKGGGRQS